MIHYLQCCFRLTRWYSALPENPRVLNESLWWTTTCAFSYCIRWPKLLQSLPYVLPTPVFYRTYLTMICTCPPSAPEDWTFLCHGEHVDCKKILVQHFHFALMIRAQTQFFCQDSAETSKWAGNFIRKESTRKRPGVAIPLEPYKTINNNVYKVH